MSESKKENEGLKFDLMRAQEPSELSEDDEEMIESPLESQLVSNPAEITGLDEEEKKSESRE